MSETETDPNKIPIKDITKTWKEWYTKIKLLQEEKEKGESGRSHGEIAADLDDARKEESLGWGYLMDRRPEGRGIPQGLSKEEYEHLKDLKFERGKPAVQSTVQRSKGEERTAEKVSSSRPVPLPTPAESIKALVASTTIEKADKARLALEKGIEVENRELETYRTLTKEATNLGLESDEVKKIQGIMKEEVLHRATNEGILHDRDLRSLGIKPTVLPTTPATSTPARDVETELKTARDAVEKLEKEFNDEQNKSLNKNFTQLVQARGDLEKFLAKHLELGDQAWTKLFKNYDARKEDLNDRLEDIEARYKPLVTKAKTKWDKEKNVDKQKAKEAIYQDLLKESAAAKATIQKDLNKVVARREKAEKEYKQYQNKTAADRRRVDLAETRRNRDLKLKEKIKKDILDLNPSKKTLSRKEQKQAKKAREAQAKQEKKEREVRKHRKEKRTRKEKKSKKEKKSST